MYGIHTISHMGLTFNVWYTPDDVNPETDYLLEGLVGVRFVTDRHPAKRPGEAKHDLSGRQWLIVDAQETLRRLRGTGARGCDKTMAAFRKRERREPTPRECAHMCMTDQIARYRRFCEGDWGFIGVEVEAVDHPTVGASLWGIESDAGQAYLDEVAQELVDEALAQSSAMLEMYS